MMVIQVKRVIIAKLLVVSMMVPVSPWTIMIM